MSAHLFEMKLMIGGRDNEQKTIVVGARKMNDIIDFLM